MARRIKEEEYSVKRNDILDAAQRLVYTKGYEQMSINDILTSLGISKGAFYHYFDSKQALLEALIERIIDEIEQVLNPIVQDPALPAVVKLQRYLDTGARWKVARKTYMLELLHVWYDDHNAIVRQKVFAETVKRITPLLTKIIHQGVEEGVFSTAHPDEAAGIIVSLFQSLGDTFLSQVLLSPDPNPDQLLPRIESVLGAYTDAMERILGAPKGSLQLADLETLREWVTLEPATPEPVA